MLLGILIIFAICIVFSFVEERIQERDKIILFVLVGLGMILIAGMRDIYDTPDSDNYERMYYSAKTLESGLREPSFTIISYYLSSLGFGINALFFTYAIISIPLRLNIIWKMSQMPLVTLAIYISHYYQLHDLIQIRTAVASALFLFAIYYRVQKKNKLAILSLIIGTLFHYAALAGFIIFLFNNKPLKQYQQIILYAIVPLGVIFYFAGFDIASFIPDEFGGNRLAVYRQLKDKGIEDEQAGWIFYKNPLVLTNICLYYGCLIYHRYLTNYDKFLPIMLKIMALAFVCMLTLENISSVLASRLNEYFEIVSIFMWTTAIYAFTPQLYGKILVNVISTARCFACMLFYTIGYLTR